MLENKHAHFNLIWHYTFCSFASKVVSYCYIWVLNLNCSVSKWTLRIQRVFFLLLMFNFWIDISGGRPWWIRVQTQRFALQKNAISCLVRFVANVLLIAEEDEHSLALQWTLRTCLGRLQNAGAPALPIALALATEPLSCGSWVGVIHCDSVFHGINGAAAAFLDCAHRPFQRGRH